MRLDTFAPPGTNLHPRFERNDRGRDLVVSGVHGYSATLRRALDEIEVNEHDRVFSTGNLVDGGPQSRDALDWISGPDPSTRFHVVLRGDHEQTMLEALLEGPPELHGRREHGTGAAAWDRWMASGGRWWIPNSPRHDAAAWTTALSKLPLCATVDTGHGPVGLVHACPVWPSWEKLEEKLVGDGDENHFTRERVLRGKSRLDLVHRYVGKAGSVHLGPVAGVRCVVTGHTPVPEPKWHHNVLAIETGVHIDDVEYRQLTITRIDCKPVKTRSFDR